MIPNPSVFNDATAKVTAFMSAEELHQASIHKPKILVAMAQGLRDAAGKEIADYENDEPFKSFFNKKMIKPSNAILWDEVERRKLMKNIQGRKTGKQWKTSRYLTWLRENPLLNTDDIAYVKDKIGVLKNCIVLAEAENKNGTAAAAAAGKAPSFRGTTAHLRLIEAVIGAEDSRMAYLKDLNSLKRHELDGRHNPLSARPNPWQLASQYYNDPSFKPVSTAYPNLHSALAVEIDCSWDAVLHLGPISPEKAKDKFSKMRVETNIVMNKWNRSGNGEGTTPRPDECADEYDPNDHLGGSSEDRANFLGTSGPHILYLWQKSDDFGILNQVVQMIADGQEFDGTAPSVYKKKNPTDKAAVDVDDERKAFLSEMHVHIRETNSNLAVYNLENMRQTLGNLRKRLHQEEDKYYDLEDAEKPPKRMRRQSDRIKEIMNDIMCQEADIQEFRENMMVTPAPAAPPGTEGTSAADSAERAADGTGGSSPPAEQDSDYSTDEDL